MCQATLIPLLKTWSPPRNFVSSPTATSGLCPRTFWKPSSSSIFRLGGEAAVSNTPLMALRRPTAAAQSKSTLYVSHRPPRPLQGLKVLPHLPPSFLLSMELTFADSMLEPLKRCGINPKTRSRDGYAVKLHPLTSCNPRCFSKLYSPRTTGRHPPFGWKPSTQGSHTWTLTHNGLLGTYTAPIPSFRFHSATVRDDILRCSSGWPPRCPPSSNAPPSYLGEDAEPNKDLTETTSLTQALRRLDPTSPHLPLGTISVGS